MLFAELRAGGRRAASTGNGEFSRAFTALELYPGANPDLDADEINPYSATFACSSVASTRSTAATSRCSRRAADQRGPGRTAGARSASESRRPSSAWSRSDRQRERPRIRRLQVNESRIFAADGGNILVWSTRGDIDAGRGAKTAISAPPPTITSMRTATAGELPRRADRQRHPDARNVARRKPGDVDLYAPRGVVNAGDAGIVAGNLTIGATAVLGANNIRSAGVAVGVPVDAGGLASVSRASARSRAARAAPRCRLSMARRSGRRSSRSRAQRCRGSRCSSSGSARMLAIRRTWSA